MNSDVVFLAAASDEFEAAEAWCFERDPDVARDFRRSLGDAIEKIAEAPDRWPPSSAGARRVLLERFPYAVHYRIDPQHVLVVAVAHQHRRPGYWHDRI